MATGDAATAAGMAIVAGSADIRDGYLEINKTRDYFADLYKKPHGEWTATSASVATGTNASVGTLSPDASKSNTRGGQIAAASTNSLVIGEDGLYDLSFSSTFSSAPAAPAYLTVADGTNSWRPGWVSGTVMNGAIFSSVYLTATTNLTFTFFQTSGGSRTLVLRAMLTKVGRF